MRPMKTVSARRVATAAFGLLGPLSLATGCMVAEGEVCPAIGWVDTLTVRIVGDPAQVADVKLCTEAGCAPSATGPAPPGLQAVSLIPGAGAGEWRFALVTRPAEFSVRAYDRDGTVLHDAPAAPDWIRIGGSERCGGPSEATVEVEV